MYIEQTGETALGEKIFAIKELTGKELHILKQGVVLIEDAISSSNNTDKMSFIESCKNLKFSFKNHKS